MRPRLREKCPLRPFVSREQIMAFDPQRPETFTESRVLNRVMEVAEERPYHSASKIAEYLDVPQRHLSGAIGIVTGLSIDEIIRMRMIPKIYAAAEANPDLSGDEIARLVGYGDHSTLFRILGREEYDRLLAKYRRS